MEIKGVVLRRRLVRREWHINDGWQQESVHGFGYGQKLHYGGSLLDYKPASYDDKFKEGALLPLRRTCDPR
jgi:hypothetical protein